MSTKKVREEEFKIVGGPDRSRIFTACEYRYDESSSIGLYFTIVDGYTMPEGHPGRASVLKKIYNVEITRTEHESTSGNDLYLQGTCLFDEDIMTGVKMVGSVYSFEMYYNSQSRNGKVFLF